MCVCDIYIIYMCICYICIYMRYTYGSYQLLIDNYFACYTNLNIFSNNNNSTVTEISL